MRKIKNINSISQSKGKFSTATSFGIIASLKREKFSKRNLSPPAGVVTFAFQPFSIIELLGSLDGGLI